MVGCMSHASAAQLRASSDRPLAAAPARASFWKTLPLRPPRLLACAEGQGVQDRASVRVNDTQGYRYCEGSAIGLALG